SETKTIDFTSPSVCDGHSVVENCLPETSSAIVYRVRPFGLRVSRSHPQKVPSGPKNAYSSVSVRSVGFTKMNSVLAVVTAVVESLSLQSPTTYGLVFCAIADAIGIRIATVEARINSLFIFLTPFVFWSPH